MAPLDTAALIPVSDDRPAGENLELDPEFGELERAAQGKPEVQYGSTIEAAVPPDWKQSASIAESLLTRTHDLRVMVHLAIAKLNLGGVPAFAPVVATIRHELEGQWAHVHPQLDPEDDNDPMQRANALARLRDPIQVMRALRDMPVVTAPLVGPVAWRDIAIAIGHAEAEPDRPKLTEAMILGAFREGDRTRAAAVRDALQSLMADLPGIVAAFDSHAGPGHSPDYEGLLKLVADMHRDVSRYYAAGAEAGEGGGAEAAVAGLGGPSEASVTAGAPGRGYASIQGITALTRREDAMHALDLAATYFRAYEPSSPLPLLIERAKRLAGMEFMDILRDLAPDGLSQAQLVTGATNE